MKTTVLIALGLWIPLAVGIFAALRGSRAVVAVYVLGTLFLPIIDSQQTGIAILSKSTFLSVSALAGALLSGEWRAMDLRPRWLDVPMVLMVLTPLASSLSNGLGLYDGVFAATMTALAWGVPYYLGRTSLASPQGARDLAVGVYLGGLLYVPLCLIEIRISPQLQNIVYGASRWQGMRLGGWRPHVFLEHGLMLGLWMTAASLMGIWLWRSGMLRRLGFLGSGWAVGLLVIVTVLCRSTGALVLLVWGCLAMVAWKRRLISWALIALVLVCAAYITARITDTWRGEGVAEAARQLGPDREGSFLFRIQNERILVDKALQRPLFGWGGWGRSRVYDEESGRDISVTDGLWVIQLGSQGMVGLAACYAVLFLPAILVAVRLPRSASTSSRFSPVAALAVLVSLFAIDGLLNSMVNQVYLVAVGAVVGYCARPNPALQPVLRADTRQFQKAGANSCGRRLATGEPLAELTDANLP